MSGINGDKARFNRKRRQNIERRARQRGLLGSLPKRAQPAAPRSHAPSKEKSA
jgi:hypothetical protein